MTPYIFFSRASKTFEAELRIPENFTMPADQVFKRRIATLQRRWDKYGEEVMREMMRVSGLKFWEKDIRVYITAGISQSFSPPIVLKAYDSPDDMFDVFCHELMHRLLNNPKHTEKYKLARNAFIEQYKNEEQITRNHLIVHALHTHILLKFFGAARLKRAQQFSKHKAYIRSWKIVNELGYTRVLTAVFGKRVLG